MDECETCQTCGGSGACPSCGYDENFDPDCPWECDDGQCPDCDGSGETEIDSPQPNQ